MIRAPLMFLRYICILPYFRAWHTSDRKPAQPGKSLIVSATNKFSSSSLKFKDSASPSLINKPGKLPR